MHRLRSTHPPTQTRIHSHEPEGRLAISFLWIHRMPDPSCADTLAHFTFKFESNMWNGECVYVHVCAPHIKAHTDTLAQDINVSSEVFVLHNIRVESFNGTFRHTFAHECTNVWETMWLACAHAVDADTKCSCACVSSLKDKCVMYIWFTSE